MIIDIHTHVGRDKDGTTQSEAQLAGSMKTNGIGASAVFPFNEPGDLVEASLRLLKHGDGILPFLRFDPKTVRASTIRELLDENDFYGVKLHPRSQDFDPLDAKYRKTYDAIAASGKPLLIHTRMEKLESSDPERIVMLGSRFPRLNVIIGHFAGMSGKALAEVGRRKNLYVETSVLSSNAVIGSMVERIGADKILFGSDCTYSDQEIELLKIRKSGITKREMEMVLHRNAAELLDV